MCGFAGFFDVGAGRMAEEGESLVREMTNSLVHRGPDDFGVWVDAAAGVALGHRRLSIIDLSAGGHQPMVSACGRYVITYNGEIYNFGELRRAIEAETGLYNWRSQSDTEVMLAAIGLWGIEKALQRFVGMFAFALWDRDQRTLSLARDRMGEKPLYYGWAGGALVFGSELKALRVFPGWNDSIDRGALTLFLRHNYVPAPHSIYQNVFKLPPAGLLEFRPDDVVRRNVPSLRQYWSLRQVAEAGLAQSYEGGLTDAVDDLESLLRDVIAGQMVSDVPLGAFLSGGVDSSTVVALMQAQSARPVKTFTIGFHEAAYNEAECAKAVAKHLGTDHTELYVTAREAMDVIPSLPRLYDEPFADSSQIPTYLVSRLARQHVTVSLSGDGGDELFAGYNRYVWGRRIWRQIGWVPPSLRHAVATAATAASPSSWDRIFQVLSPLLPAKVRYANPGDKIHKLAEILESKRPEALYLGLVSHWKHPSRVVKEGEEPATVLTDPAQWANLPDFVQRMMYLDALSYLPDDILTKVDRASMGVSLESRIPFLDKRVLEFAWRIPLEWNMRDGRGKWLLRQVLSRHVPNALIERPKMGFGVPIDVWLRGPLREWAEDLIAERKLREQGFFEVEPIRRKWAEHLSGRRNWQYYLWDVLMFQAWFEMQGAKG